MKTLQNKGAGFTAGLALSLIAASAPSASLANTETKTEQLASQTQASPSEGSSALDPESIKKGKQNYAMFCQGCHGPEDNGIDSPSNLFDPKWHYGAGRSGVEQSIRNGIMEKGMPSWGAMIPSEDITALVDYLMSFQKTNTSPDE